MDHTLHPATALFTCTLLVTAGADDHEDPKTVESFDGTEIDALVYKPTGASAEDPAPVILHSHGWGGSRASDCSPFSEYLDAGIGAVSITQRGFGDSGGHALPNGLPPGTTASSHPCPQALGYEGFGDLEQAFLEHHLNGAQADLPDHAYNLATDGGACVTTDSLDTTSFDVGPANLAATPTAAGAPVYLPVTEGPLTIAGVPALDATLTSAGVDQRAFLGLATGTSPADAQVLSNNLMPVQSLTPALQEPVSTELPGVAVDLAEDETLYLVLTPTSGMHVHHGSRTPGAMLFQDVTVDLPLQG